jgi:hypothetical protein
MSDPDAVRGPPVDEPIGAIVARLQAEHPEIDELVAAPHRLPAFRRLASLRVGVLCGRLLVERDVPDFDGTETWIEALLRDRQHREAVVDELRAVAQEVAADPRYADERFDGL